MTALTVNAETARKDGELIAYLVAAATHIYKGALVCLNASGYAVPAADATGLSFIGIAYEEADNSSGTNGATLVRVLKSGTYFLCKSSAVQGDVGKLVCVVDDATVAADTTNDIPVGYVVEVPDANHVRVRINREVK